MNFPKRFSLRMILLLTCVIAIGLAFAPRAYQRFKWHEERMALIKWSDNVKREPNHSDAYSMIANNGRYLVVSTAECEVLPDGGVVPGDTPDPVRFFVVPPGKWVDTIDEVLVTWEQYD